MKTRLFDLDMKAVLVARPTPPDPVQNGYEDLFILFGNVKQATVGRAHQEAPACSQIVALGQHFSLGVEHPQNRIDLRRPQLIGDGVQV